MAKKLTAGGALIWRFNTRKDVPMARQDGQKGTSNRGFASMDEARQREIALRGGALRIARADIAINTPPRPIEKRASPLLAYP